MISLKPILTGLLLLAFVASEDCNATLAHYLSPHSLGKQDELADALKILCKQVRPNITRYQYGKTNYTLYNVSVNCIYNDGKQVADIPSNNTIAITGGKVEFAVNFNVSVTKMGVVSTAWGYASVMSEVVNFSKTIARQGAQTLWVLTGDLPKITLISPLQLKRIEPKQTEDDNLAIQQALSSAISSITPANVRQQIETLVNENLTAILNQTLKEEVFNSNLKYTFRHPFKGDLGINFTNYFHLFRIGPEEGFELMYLTFIENGSTTFCQWDLPVKHEDYTIFGGIQSAYSLDLVAEVARYALKKGWLDTSFETVNWETNSFQFYAGDLYDVINQTQKLAPRTRINGDCKAVDGTLNVSRKNDQTLKMDVSYNCKLSLNDTSRTPIVTFLLPTSFYIKLKPEYESLEFTIDSANGTASFQSTGTYVVTDEKLANFKISMALRQLQGQRVFGSGFPLWPRDLPDVMVHSSGKYFLVYDSSQVPHSQIR